MAIKDYPANIRPDSEEWSIISNTQKFTSELTGVSQTAILPGAKWRVSVTYSSRVGRAARELQGFIAGLEGEAGRFWFTPTDWEPLGNPAGNPTVSLDANSGAAQITVTGWNTNIAELFVAGDYFEINGELKKVTETTSSDAGGTAIIKFAPRLRADALVGNVIRYTEPRCKMKLSDDSQAKWSLSAPIIYATSLEFVEALDI